MARSRHNERGLTKLQEAFCQELNKGKQQRQAYRDAGYSPNGSNASVDTHASELAKTEKIQARLRELQAQVDAGAIASLEQIQADLFRIANDTSKPDGVRLKAYDQLTRMRGGYIDRSELLLSGEMSIQDTRDAIDALLD